MVDPLNYFLFQPVLHDWCNNISKLSIKQERDVAFAHGAMGRRIDPSCGGPIELFLVPTKKVKFVLFNDATGTH